MKENQSIREMINSYQIEILKGNLLPERTATILVELSSLLGNISEEILQRDVAYNKVLLSYLEVEKSANRAKIKSDITPEYESMRTARNAEKVAVEMIRSLKYLLKAQQEEFRQSNN